MADELPFEIWPEVHTLAQRNVEQARLAYGQFMDFLTQTLSASSKVAPNALFPGFRTAQERAIEFARENAERFFTLESELARANNMQQVLTLQSAYVQAQMKAYSLQAQELGRLMAANIPKFSRTIAVP
jgi:hypothetical protein